MLFYLFTFIFGALCDSEHVSRLKHCRQIRIVYVVWLFIFLCFGYMTGSDWRSYELEFYDSSFFFHSATYEFGFWLVLDILHSVFKDFFIVLALLKIIYLLSFIILAKALSKQWITLVAFSLPLCLVFMLIDNPLRFMCANVFINFAILFFIKGKNSQGVVLALLASLFQMTSLVTLPLLLVLFIREKICAIKPIFLIATYVTIFILVVIMFSSFSSRISGVYLFLNSLGSKDYNSYLVQSSESAFSLGSLKNFFLFLFIVFNRKSILRCKHGDLIFCFSILYFYLYIMAILVPTGFRMAIPFALFVACALLILVSSNVHKLYRYILYPLILLLFFLQINSTYVFVPYTNSIPYIVRGHLPYEYRDYYNIQKFYDNHHKMPDNM